MSEKSFLTDKAHYNSRLKNRMLCKYMEIINRHSDGMGSELAEDLEVLIHYAKECGRDKGFEEGVGYSGMLWQAYIASTAKEME